MFEWQSIAGVLPGPSLPPSTPAGGDFLVDSKLFIVDKKQNQLATIVENRSIAPMNREETGCHCNPGPFPYRIVLPTDVF